jgi:hypothetical protein
MPKRGDVPQPPQPPSIERKLRLDPLQLIGVPLLAAIPVLALAGVFGVSIERLTGDGDALSLSVEYPVRTRLMTGGALEIEVTNNLSQPLSGVVLDIGRDYVEAFSQVTFTPSASGVNEDYYRVELGVVPASASRVVLVQFSPERYWRHQGTITASDESGNSTSVDVRTFVYP